MQRSDFRHFIELPVRWGDMDAFGHVNNVQYMRYLESGRIAYVGDVLGAPLEPKENIVLADIQCSFLQPLHYPVTVEVATRVARLGNSSLQILFAIYRKGESEPVLTGKGVLVWFDFINQQAIPLPDATRKAILDFEIIPPEV
jgi:acyl-CoA thioester hydrolase